MCRNLTLYSDGGSERALAVGRFIITIARPLCGKYKKKRLYSPNKSFVLHSRACM